MLMTGAITEGEDGTPMVIHFAVPMKAAEVQHRGYLADARHARHRLQRRRASTACSCRTPAFRFTRKAGEWHPVFQMIATIAFPLIYAVYLGVAESARDIAVELARKKPVNDHAVQLAGRMDTALRAAQLAHRHMVEVAETSMPSAEAVNEGDDRRARWWPSMPSRRSSWRWSSPAALGFYRVNGLERRFRDIQGARFHPLQQGPQARYAGADGARPAGRPDLLSRARRIGVGRLAGPSSGSPLP